MSVHLMVNALSVGSGGGRTVAGKLVAAVAALRPLWTLTVVLAADDDLQSTLVESELPGSVHVLWAPSRASGRFFRVQFERRAMARWAAANEVDVVIQLNGMLVRKIAQPTIAHFQDPWPYRPVAWTHHADRLLAWLKRRENKYALRHAAAATFTSEYLRDLVTGELGVVPVHSEILHNGVDSHREIRVKPLGFADRRAQIMTLSTVMPHKRHEIVIGALPAVLAEPSLRDLTYRIAGRISPRRRHALMALADSLGVAGNVVIEGEVSEEQKATLLGESRAFVLMSVCESFGIPALEAMSLGAPVLVTECCSFPEICAEAAIYVNEDDTADLSRKLTDLLTSPSNWARQQDAGLIRAREFNWTRTGETLVHCVDEVLSRSERSGA